MAQLLIVDDEKNIRRYLARFFRERGYDAQTAESGPQALAMFSERGAEVVLTDYRMAEMNGHELLKRMRERDPNVMVILMTAYATVENAVAAMKDGAYDYLTKPFSLESELFGHLKGAFTGAIKDTRGLLENANGGTVFLGEIADLSAALQAKFSRFVQEQTFQRVGGGPPFV